MKNSGGFLDGVLQLSNGLKMKGSFLGSEKIGTGELVFTTGMVGYTQALTDPSYFGQILVFTYPLMGNYGVPRSTDILDNIFGLESEAIKVAGVVMSQDSTDAYHWASKNTLEEWLRAHSIPALTGVDTRLLTQLIRDENKDLLAAVGPSGLFDRWSGPFYNPNEQNLLPEVSVKQRKIFGNGKKRVALIDCGVKWNIVRELLRLNCEVEVLPWDTDFKSVDADGWLISNGPGDPKQTGDLLSRLTPLFEVTQPVLGICLGFQLMALANGAQTRKLKFGHRGHNQPVELLGHPGHEKKYGFMTSQNHGFEVIEDSLPSGWSPWFRHVNDHTLEGIKCDDKPFRGVQFHPEAAAGPQDTSWILEEFVNDLGHGGTFLERKVRAV